ncbi:MAG TPA: BrnT family toxin [Candidatus Methylomirabilis sp.]|nr:BrnT family toxin [Candidatus Methylomirabilis sp.]
MDDLSKCRGFQWDEGNAEKNWIKHRVSRVEIEQAFFNRPLVVAEGGKGSDREHRYYTLGQTDEGRRLFIVFTIRDDLVRVISARNMNRRERRAYEHAKEAAETNSDV